MHQIRHFDKMDYAVFNIHSGIGKALDICGYACGPYRTMPENPNVDSESALDGFYGNSITMATTNSNSNGIIPKKTGVPRVSSAGLKYYDIATQLLGKTGPDLEELFIAAAREGVYERIENFLQRNRTEYVISIDVKDKKTGNTPLIWAAKRGHAKIVQLLLQHGADVTLRNYEGHTALDVASPSIRSILLESVERTTEASHQLLLQAAWQGDIKVILRLLSQKKVLDINCKNADGYTPIMLATRDMQLFERLASQMSRPYNPVEVVTELLNARADLHATDEDGKSCLHHACSSKAIISQAVVSTIVACGPNMEQKDKRCFAPLHCASLTGNVECITTLLEGGSEVNSRGFAGATALHITSYNNHEKATSVLLEHGANVTLTDDRGLNPVDLAKTRKMRKKLQEAWTEATTAKTSLNLGPIRSFSKEDLRASVEDLTKKKKKGEVIFEGLPSNPFGDSNKKDSIANPKGLTRHLSLKDRSGREEDHSQSFARDGVRKLGQVRNQQKPNPLPRTKSRSTERLPMISPDRQGSDRNLESPVMFGRNSRARRSFEDRKGRGRRAPLSTREGVAGNHGEDVFDPLTPGGPSPTTSVNHRRSESDPNRGTPNLSEIAAGCDPYMQAQRRGRSYSVTSNPPIDPISNHEYNRTSPQFHGELPPFTRECTVASILREATCTPMSICSYRTDSRMSHNGSPPKILSLGQMLGGKSKTPVQQHYGPGSSKVLPPTPTFLTQRAHTNLEDNLSPRSEENLEDYKYALGFSQELSRSRTIFKEEFVLEESRPKDPFIRSSSGSDSVSTSSSSQLSDSSRESPLSMKGKIVKSVLKNSVKPALQGTQDQSGVTCVNKNNSCTNVHENKAQNENIVPNLNVNGNAVEGTSKVDRSDTSKVKVGVSSSNTSLLHSIAMRNAAALHANNAKGKAGAKHGGVIVVHNNEIDKPVQTSGTTHVPNGLSEVESDNKIESSGSASDKISDSTMQNDKSAEKNQKSDKTKPVNAVSNAKKKAQNKMQNVLQVVPTKLTQNIIRTAPKGSVKTERTESAKQLAVNKVSAAKTVINNVNMQLSPSAQVVNVMAITSSKAGNENKEDDKFSGSPTATTGNQIRIENTKCNVDAKNEPFEQLNEKKIGQNQPSSQSYNSNNPSSSQQSSNKSTVSTSKLQPSSTIQSQPCSTSQSLPSSTCQPQPSNTSQSSCSTNQSSCATGSSVQKSRNAKFSVPKSASVGYTPRFASGKNNSQQDKSSVALSASSKRSVSKCEIKEDESTKTVATGSPTELVTPSVNKSASILKSYNMSSSTSVVKSNSNGSLKSDTSATKTSVSTSEKSDVAISKHSLLSKSVSEPMQSTEPPVEKAVNVNKSISQLPSVGTVSSAKGIPRPASMSTIDEAKEKKLMSSSDTKIETAKTANSKRPSSDGQVGASGHGDKVHEGTSGTTPLLEILPDGVTKLNRKNYVDFNNPITTPVIVNPFEELEKKRERENAQKLGGRALTATEFGFVVDKPNIERSKTQSSMKSRSGRSAKRGSNKPSSAQSRGSSGKKKRSRSKDVGNKSDNESCRPKSGKNGKRVKSGKRKRKIPENQLARQNEKPDVALIGGIGWQIATSCIDKSEADAVIVSQIDSSESESESTTVRNVNQMHLDIPNTLISIPYAIETPSSVYSPRFREVHLRRDDNAEQGLQFMDNDGYRPMNLDMTQKSSGSKNRSGVLIAQDMPNDILSEFQDDESEDYGGDDEDFIENDFDYEIDENGSAILRGIAIGQLTPIPESPSISNTLTSAQRVSAAISKFDRQIKEEDLNKLLGATPRDKTPSRSGEHSLRNSGGSLRTSQSHSGKDSQKSPGSGQSRSQQSRNSSSKSRTTNFSADIKEKASRALSKSLTSPKAKIINAHNKNKTVGSVPNSGSLRRNASSEQLSKVPENTNSDVGEEQEFMQNSIEKPDNNQTKERIDSKIMDLKKLLADKLQSTQKLLEESATYSGKKRKQSENSIEGDTRLNISELTEDNLKTLNTARTEEDSKSNRSSRKERKFSETKNSSKDDDVDQAINEILSNTFSSSRGTLKSNVSIRSASSTLTEADRKVLVKMVQNSKESPFHAKEQVRVSSSYEESVTLNKDNPELMRRFQAENFQVGQRLKAMVDAGADTHKVKAMLKADNEAQQLARIMNSFRQMELYAGVSNSKSKRETPRHESEQFIKSMSKFEHGRDSGHLSHGMLTRPGSAGAGKLRPGKFTEIKGGNSASTESREQRAHSPVDVPKNLAEEFRRSPFVRVSSQQDLNVQIDELAHVIRAGSHDSEEDHFSLADSEHERADSACTTLSSMSSLVEDTIQWKKGNILGKGAFGTVWCGLTSEGQLIAVKQIELNTTNQNKAKKEYEKVQEEVELLKTLEHKNIVGYLGTSLEDSIVSIFMQFVPGGSIASILARFGALDEAVFKKYTRQILEGVEYLHRNDVIHRDIKGGNVMLMPNGVIKLIDFGCAKRLCINLSMGQSQILKSMKGTPYWMAPEVVNETGHGKKSDIWSIGCTVFEMATRKPPWAEMNPMAAIFAIGSDKPVPQLPEKFTEEARQFVTSCLTKDQSKRPSATELLSNQFLKRRSKKSSMIEQS
ncbi:uncharacterized protein LOC127852295 isoform X2 [Dreissena polymorpha]|nr:uncharacterized protein LOC127852295 isoform X2 [Dreissena polymorpha]